MLQHEKSEARNPGFRERLEMPELVVVGRAGSRDATPVVPVVAFAALADFLLPMLPFLFLLAVLPLDERRTGCAAVEVWGAEGAPAVCSSASRVSSDGFSDVEVTRVLDVEAVVSAIGFSGVWSAEKRLARVFEW